MVRYEYDSWGNILSIKDSNGNNITSSTNIGIINPYRYRSYRYDTETGLYYLQSRYYNSEWGRYINVDGYVQTGQGMLDKNMYIYCENNPINRADSSGMFWKKIGKFFKSVISTISGLFGVSSQTSVVQEETVSKTPSISPVSVKTGTVVSTATASKRCSSKPISVYSNGVANSPTSSIVGVKVNIVKASMDFSIGLSDTGLKFSLINDDLTSSAALRLDITKLQIGFEVEIEKQINATVSESVYANASINGAFLGAAYVLLQTGTWNASLQPAY